MASEVAPLKRWFDAVNSDARHWQILALSSLFWISFTQSDFGATPWALAAAVSGAMLAQGLGTYFTKGRFEWKSALITSLSLSILLRATNPVFWFFAALVGIGAKFLIRYNKKHIFNPACIGLVVITLAAGSGAWISPGQWGQASWFAAVAIGLGALVLSSAKRIDIALGFLAAFAAMLFGRALWLGDPLTIPAHQMQSGALLVFAFFMITDPRSTPDSRIGRLVFAAAVAALAAWLSWGPHVRGSVFYALAALAVLTPVIDRLLPAARFQWNKNKTGSGVSEEDTTHDQDSRATGARPVLARIAG